MNFKESSKRSPLLFSVVAFVITLWPAIASSSLIITSPFFFEDHTGPNPLGLPTGDLMQLGAFITPSGAPTVATATQGSTVVKLNFNPQPIFPSNYEVVLPFDPALTGAWAINATSGTESAGPVLTPEIPIHNFLPLVNNLRVVGTDLTPELMWEWPDIVGFQAYGVRVIDFSTGAHIYQQFKIIPSPLAGTTGMFEIPAGILASDNSYIFRITLLAITRSPIVAQYRSATYTQTPFVSVPEPSGFFLVVVGTLVLMLSRRWCHRRNMQL